MGATNNIKKLAGVTHQHGAYLVVDGAQAVSHLNINVQNLDCDFYIFSAHKMCGPTGIGIIYGKKELLEKMEPVEYGGEMVSEIDFENDNNVWQKIPNKFEAGTALTAEIFGLSAAIDYLNQIDLNNIHQHIVELRAYAVEQLKTLPNIKIYNEENIQTGIITFNHLNVHPHDAASVYDKHNVSLRAGHQCSMGTMEFLGVGSVLRASFYFYNTKEDVDKFIEATKQIDNYLEIITS
jgi:cysteine desulfurase/selenocysteine lyase